MGKEAAGSTAAGGLAGLAGPIGLGIQAIGAGFSIAEAIKQKRDQRDAERTAKELVEQAKSRVEVNRMEGLQVPLDSYDQAMREVTAQQMQSLEGLREADARTLAAGVGKLAAAGSDATELQRQAMEGAIFDRDKLIAMEQQNIDRSIANIDLKSAEGAQQMAADADAASAMNLQSAVKGLGGAFQSFAENQDLYKRQKTNNGTQYQNLSSEQINRIVPNMFANMFGTQAPSQAPSYLSNQQMNNMLGIQAPGQVAPFQFNASPFQFNASPFQFAPSPLLNQIK
jgi:hypothetical protein